MEYFNLLPEEITLNILSRLPTESVLECKLVCTNWRSVVRRSSFSKMHLDHLNHPASDSGKLGFIALTTQGIIRNFQYFEYNENHGSTKPIERIRRLYFSPLFGRNSSFIGSSNGLICVSRLYSEEKTYIFNPITREYIMLPEINSLGLYYEASGFGYVASTNEYKVVRIMSPYETETDTEVYVYTLGSGHGWRNLGKFTPGTDEQWETGIFVNGALHWLNYQLKMMVTFDLAEEKFCKHISPPLPPNDDFNGTYQLGVFDGCLSFAINRHVDNSYCWDVRLLKKKDDNHGMKEREGHQSLCWGEEFRVYDSRLFAVTKSGDVLTYQGHHINIHNLEALTSKMIVDFKERFYEVYPHKNTLVSLKESGEENTKIMESVETEETDRKP